MNTKADDSWFYLCYDGNIHAHLSRDQINQLCGKNGWDLVQDKTGKLVVIRPFTGQPTGVTFEPAC